MALVYCVMCHDAPSAVAELVRAIWRPEHHYILHADRKAPAALHATVARLAAAFRNVHALPSALCSWAGWSLVETTLRAMEHAVSLPAGWQHFILLSESHLPLVAPDDAAAALRPGVSYVEATPVMAMNPHGRSDVLHRFAARYHELPGVGMFALAPRMLNPAFVAMLHHGSQWMVLARTACERLVARRGEAAVWEPFRSAVLADETALQTLLAGSALGQGLTLERRSPTFVAWPQVSGNAHMIFNEDNFFAARAQGYLFIRKRPATLPEAVASALAQMQPAAAMPELPQSDEPGTAPHIAALAAALRHALRSRHPEVEVHALPAADGGAACHLRFQTPAAPAGLSVALLSQDLAQFKVVLARRQEAGLDFRTGTLGGYPTSVLKVRLATLFQQREVILTDLPGGGLVAMTRSAPLDRLVAPIAHALDAAARLAPVLAGD